jgi:hypothetical protein
MNVLKSLVPINSGSTFFTDSTSKSVLLLKSVKKNMIKHAILISNKKELFKDEIITH